MSDIKPMTNEEIEKLRKVCGLGIGISGHKGSRLITTIDALKAERDSLLNSMKPKCPDCLSVRMSHCSDPINCGGVYWPDHMYRKVEVERDQARREALEEAAKALCPFCNGKHEWLAANPINEGYGWRHKYQRKGRESSHFVNCRAWAIRTLELSTIRPMKTIRALAAKEKS